MNNIYTLNNTNIIEFILLKKRIELCEIINLFLKDYEIYDALDIGTTDDNNSESSNFLIKNLKNISKYKSISDQVIKNQMFDKILNKSITDDFEDEEINEFRSDLVISNAVIEHVGNFDNQIKMIKNIKKLTKKLFIIITPNRNHPIEFHTYLPLIHMLPKKIHREILSFIKLGFFSMEENLNLLTEKELIFATKSSKVENFSVDHLNFLGFKSNIILYANLEKSI